MQLMLTSSDRKGGKAGAHFPSICKGRAAARCGMKESSLGLHTRVTIWVKALNYQQKNKRVRSTRFNFFRSAVGSVTRRTNFSGETA